MPQPTLFLFWVSLCASFALTGRAAQYFVDFEGGADTNSGTTAESAWKHCPGDTAATDKPKAVGLAAGDTVRFKGGVVYLGGFDVVTSGKAGAPILYDGSGTQGWGTGRAVIDRDYAPSPAVNGAPGVSEIVVRGFEIRHVGGYRPNDPVLSLTNSRAEGIKKPIGGTAVRFSDGGHRNLRFENLILHEVGQWRNQKPFDGPNSITGMGLSLEDCDGLQVTHCDFSRMRIGLSLKAREKLSNVDVGNCEFHDYLVWAIDVAPRKDGAVLTNIAIHDTIIRDYHQYDSGNWKGFGEKPHTDGIFFRNSGMFASWQDVRVYNCDFYADYFEKSKGGTASIYISQGPSVMIYNNTFRRDRHSRCIGVGFTSRAAAPKQIIRIYNNTFLNSSTPIVVGGTTNIDRQAIYIANNILVREGGSRSKMINHNSGLPPAMIDYNLYYDPGASAGGRKVFYSPVLGSPEQRTVSEMRAIKYEEHGLYADPKMTKVGAALPSQNDVRPGAGSPALGIGLNLSEFFTTDKAGRERPKSGPWDLGAYSGSSKEAGSTNAPATESKTAKP